MSDAPLFDQVRIQSIRSWVEFRVEHEIGAEQEKLDLDFLTPDISVVSGVDRASSEATRAMVDLLAALDASLAEVERLRGLLEGGRSKTRS
jgi:hypothetical protein